MDTRKKRVALALCAAGFVMAGVFSPHISYAGTNNETLTRLLQAKPTKKKINISPVRAAALRSTAHNLGTQSGLIEQAKIISEAIDKRKTQMEREFRFGDMVIGAGVLPPVIVETKNAASVQNDSMRLAGAVYKLIQPARFFSGAPSWRDWLLMGLPVEEEMPEIPSEEQLLPRDTKEREFWKQEVAEAYANGRAQAREIFEENLSQLEQTYMGMRTFYELYQRNMVSAPTISESQEIVTQDDGNTIVLGDTLFRITQPSEFNINPKAWRALQANPAQLKKLPIVFNYDPEQVELAYKVHKESVERIKAQKKQAKSGAKKEVVKPAVQTITQTENEPAQTGVISTVGEIKTTKIVIEPQAQASKETLVDTNPVIRQSTKTAPLFNTPTSGG